MTTTPPVIPAGEGGTTPASQRPWPLKVLLSRWTFQGVVASLFLGLAATQVHGGDLSHSFRSAAYGWLAFVLAIYVASRMVHALEWRITLAKIGRPPFGGLFGSILIGTLVSTVVPASAGEAAKIQIVANRYGLSRTGLIATRGAEGVVNALIMVVFIVVSVALPQSGFASPRTLALLISAAVVAFAGVAVASRVLPEELPPWRLFTALPARANGVLGRAWPRLHGGFEVVRRPRLLVIAVALNLFGWFVDMLILWSYGQAFHLQLPLTAYLSVTVAVAIVTTFPLTPGNVGTYEFALLRVLDLYDVPSEQALAFAIGTHVFTVVFNIGLGRDLRGATDGGPPRSS
jgi:uncharacterized membrane protein YbhN (UPF0104 family)